MSRGRTKPTKLRMNDRLTREKDRARTSELRRLLLLGAAIVVPLLGYVWQRVDFIRTSYRVDALQEERQRLDERNKQMTIERAMLMSPQRIEKVARRRLGLVDPPPENVRRVQIPEGRPSDMLAASVAGLPGPDPGRGRR